MTGPHLIDPRRLARGEGMAAFRHRNYQLFFGGQAISLVGSWMMQVAQAWLVLELTGDPLWLGIVAAAQFIPVLIFGLFAGVYADSLPKRQTLIVTQIVKMSLSVILAVLALSGLATVPILILIALAIGTTNAVDMPVRQSFVVEMVGREDIGNAVALNSAMFNGARIVGPAVAGLTIGAVGVAMAFVVDAFSFLAVIGALAAMQESELQSPARIARPDSFHGVMSQLREGLSYVRATPVVLMAMLVLGLVATVGMNFGVIIPAYAQDVLDSGAAGYGFLMAASGVGSLIAALWLAFGHSGRIRHIAHGAILLGIGEVGLGVSTVFPVSILLMVAVGFGGILMAATANTTIQMAVPDGLRGRVMSVYTTIFAGSTPIGGPLMGGLASFLSIAISLAIGGLLAVGVGIGALVWIRRLGLDAPLTRGGTSGTTADRATNAEQRGPPDVAAIIASVIVVAGEALIDLLVRPDGGLSATPGGGPFNTARTIGRLGGRVAFLGCLAADRFGRRLRASLIADGVEPSLVTTTDLPTTLAIAELDEAGAATYRFHTAETAAPALDPRAVAAALASDPSALHVGTLGLVLDPMATALAAGVGQLSGSTLLMIDPNCRPLVIRDRSAYLERLDRILVRADVVKVSTDDLAYLAPGLEPLAAARAILARGPSVVLLTDGGRPLVVLARRETLEIAVPVEGIVDTVGAGDAFGGAFLARWIERGLDRTDLADPAAVREAATMAIEVAHLTCQRPGADPPWRSETRWPSV